MTQQQPKYRPVMTENMLRECYSDIREGETKEYLRKFLVKIGAGLTAPGYIPTPTNSKNTIANSLGFTEEAEKPFIPYAERNPAELHTKWLNDPLSVTSDELELIHTYRWENDLMDATEIAEYEKKLFS